MSSGFNQHEKQFITDSLLEQGKILFSKFGFQKTSIMEITRSVGIAQGTFYNFFNSKEELYFNILEIEEDKIRKQLINTDIFKDNKPNEAIKDILSQMIRTVESNPLIRELYFGDNMENMLKKLPPETLEKHFDNDTDSLESVIKQWNSEGIIFKENPKVIAGMLRSLFILTLHQKEIGMEVYERTIDLLIDLIVDGLVK